MSNLLELNTVRFLPWIGKYYHKGGIFKNRILVLGEGHHCGGCPREGCENDFESDCRFFTSNVVKKYLNRKKGYEKWMNTYIKFERSLIGDWTDEESQKNIWDSIAFYNYIQYALDKSRKAGEGDAYIKAIKPFYQVLDYLKPELIIVWGKRLWKNLPGDERWEESVGITMDDGYIIDNGYYKLDNGDKSKVFPVYHPSAGYDWSYWHKAIITMLRH